MRIVSVNATTPEHARVFDIVRGALMECLSLGGAEVERVCNEERERRLLLYRAMPPTSIPEPTLPNITAAVAIDELTPPFALIEPPDPIVIDFAFRRRRDFDPSAADDRPSMAVTIPGLHVLVFTDAIDVGALRARYLGSPLREIVFHEFLHLCGDATLNGATDGILRHNLAGIDAIRGRLATP